MSAFQPTRLFAGAVRKGSFGSKAPFSRPTASGLPPSADLFKVGRHVSKVPISDIATPYSITSSARPSNNWGTVRPNIVAVLRLMNHLDFRGPLDRQVGGFLALEKLKAKQWGFSSKKSELFVDEPGPPVRSQSRLEICPPPPHDLAMRGYKKNNPGILRKKMRF